MSHVRLCIVGLLMFPACEGATVVPSPAAPAPAPSTLNPPYTLSGVVRVAGLPAAGAAVALLTFEAGALITSTVTDASGSYRLSDVRNVSPFSGALVSVSKPDYFTQTRYIWMGPDKTAPFDLEPAAHVSLGQAITSEVGAAARCASLGYGGGGGAVCRRLALTVPESGTLEVAVFSTPASPFDLTILRPDGTIGVYGSSPSELRLSLDVAAGLTYQIDIVHFSPAVREFELRTTMK